MAVQTTPGGNLYDDVNGVKQDKATALNRDARDLGLASRIAARLFEYGQLDPLVIGSAVETHLSARIVVSETAPASPTAGLIWFSPGVAPTPNPGATLEETLLTDPDLLARWTGQTAPTGALASLAPSHGTWTTPLAQPVTARQPVVTGNGPNGTNVIEFSAALEQSIEGEMVAQISAPATMFVVFSSPGGNSKSIITGVASTPYMGLQTTSGGSLMMNSNAQPSGIQDSTWAKFPEWVVVAMVYQADGTGRFYVNSLTPATGPMAAAGATQSLRVARRSGTSTGYIDMTLADLAVVGREMTDSDVADVLTAYANEYGLVLS